MATLRLDKIKDVKIHVIDDNERRKRSKNSMNNLKNWTEITRGLYRYVIAAGACYEIHILHWDHDTDVLSANCNLYVTGEWRDSDGSYFERELLLTGPMAACLQKAVEDYNDNVEEE